MHTATALRTIYIYICTYTSKYYNIRCGRTFLFLCENNRKKDEQTRQTSIYRPFGCRGNRGSPSCPVHGKRVERKKVTCISATHVRRGKTKSFGRRAVKNDASGKKKQINKYVCIYYDEPNVCKQCQFRFVRHSLESKCSYTHIYIIIIGTRAELQTNDYSFSSPHSLCARLYIMLIRTRFN